MPLAVASVNLAGQTSRVTGTVARVFGWIALVVGSLVSLGTWQACAWVAEPGSAAPLIVAGPMLALTWVLSYFLLRGGTKLRASGAQQAKATRAQAVYALASMRGGRVTAFDLAQAIQVSVEDADAILTSLAKEQPDHVAVDVDDDGNLFYRFSAAHWHALASNPANWEPRPRVEPAPARVVNEVRVANEVPRVGDPAEEAALREAELELEAELASDPAVPARQRAR